MKSTVSKYKNIDKSTQILFDETGSFKVFHFNNLGQKNEAISFKLKNNFIQLYFSLKSENRIAFNFEHCAISLAEHNSSMVYFKDNKLNVFCDLPPQGELLTILIPIDYFHSLFSIDGNFLFNFGNFNFGKPIMENKETGPSIKIILNQMVNTNAKNHLRSIYLKGKIYELLSIYFNESIDSSEENCPFIANEETIIKIKNAKQIILDEMNNPPSLQELATRVGLNIKKLKNDFKEFYGAPVFSFLLNYKMELAKTLLLEQQLNVNEIGSQLGYSTSSHFIAAFKRKYGITPKQYAKS